MAQVDIEKLKLYGKVPRIVEPPITVDDAVSHSGSS